MQCQVRGNHYENCFTVTLADETFVFDCFECAIHALAPSCAHCCRIVGHGIERSDEVFRCERCARAAASGDDAAYADDEASDDDAEEDGEDDSEDDDLEDVELVDDDAFEDEEDEAMHRSTHRHRRN